MVRRLRPESGALHRRKMPAPDKTSSAALPTSSASGFSQNSLKSSPSWKRRCAKCVLLAGACVRAVWFITAGARRFAVDGCSFAVCHSAADARRFATGVAYSDFRRSRSIFCLYHCRKHLPCRQIRRPALSAADKKVPMGTAFCQAVLSRSPSTEISPGLRCFQVPRAAVFDERGFSSAVLAPDDVVLS